jgi:hypothetical protein
MEQRIKKIYNELYSGVKKKAYLSEKMDVSTKTIENTVAKCSDEIIFDKKLGGYRFTCLLPNKIPSSIFFKFFQDSIDNKIIKDDFLALSKAILTQNNDFHLPMIPIDNLSNLAQKIIMLNLAVNNNCTVSIDYFGTRGELETKYIKPHKVFYDNAKYYVYGSYIEENGKNIGEYRTFALNGINDIKEYEYFKGESFLINKDFNAYGLVNKEQFAILNLESVASNFFKREGLFNKAIYEFIMEDLDGSITIKVYYNNIQELVSLVQQWMPFVSVQGEIAETVHKRVKENYETLALKINF